MAYRSRRGSKSRSRGARRAPVRKSKRGRSAVRGGRGREVRIVIDTGARPYPGMAPAKSRKVF